LLSLAAQEHRAGEGGNRGDGQDAHRSAAFHLISDDGHLLGFAKGDAHLVQPALQELDVPLGRWMSSALLIEAPSLPAACTLAGTAPTMPTAPVAWTRRAPNRVTASLSSDRERQPPNTSPFS
jgi:hypothetical protein